MYHMSIEIRELWTANVYVSASCVCDYSQFTLEMRRLY